MIFAWKRDSALEVASYIRKHQADEITRIIIQMGQHGKIPEREIIDRYDINDYKSKTDLTVEKLFISIRTAIAQDEQNTYIKIKDNAGRIKKELLLKVFDPYFSTKEDKNGHGLGLYTSKNIIEQRCKGKLSLQSSNDTSTFTITLPNK